jgi:drug/metabolite transporter (DMT)-like permease
MQYVALLISTAMAALAQFLFKLGVNSMDVSNKSIAKIILSESVNPYIWGGVICYALNLSLWLYVLSQMELSKAYPMTSLAYIFTLFIGLVFLDESITITKLCGIGLVIGGTILLTR